MWPGLWGGPEDQAQVVQAWVSSAQRSGARGERTVLTCGLELMSRVSWQKGSLEGRQGTRGNQEF